MREFTLVAPCHFGTGAVLKREIYDMGYDVTAVTDGRVAFAGDAEAVVRANFSLRTAERVLLLVGNVHAETFDELFEGIKALPWEDYLPRNARFWVTKASSVRSKLFSGSDIQRIAKKAMVERMKMTYSIEQFPEDGDDYPVRIFFRDDVAEVAIDTSGDSLHKRGYRALHGEAPISETLAASVIGLTPWRPGRILVDPFCGSGTFPIEAAMIACHIAPGINRSFTAQKWTHLIPKALWDEIRDELKSEINIPSPDEVDIQGYDADPQVLKAARANAQAAGVDSIIHFQHREVKDLSHHGSYGFVITNPPYGERLEERSALPALYGQIADGMKRLDTWSFYIISGWDGTEGAIGRKSNKRRKLYNGMIRTDLFMYPGPKPPRRK
ncbi:MAG: class I SAM-dependent RNA methyltransferase [Eubacterium sp.]|nr:class I SAM-dependent RNA methyltransferase [Eubacterium sp.]